MSTIPFPAYVLDTNTFSALLQGLPLAVHRFTQEVGQSATFLLCPVVWYEMRRGLLRQKASRKLSVFDQLSATFLWNDFTAGDWQLAATAWPQLVTAGQMPDDADLLIAVFAARRNAIVVTPNQKHFRPLLGVLNLQIEDWI